MKTEKQWRPFDGPECPNCGCSGSAEVFTKSDSDNYAYDGEKVRCKKCKYEGETILVDEGCIDVVWNDIDYGL